MRFLARFRVQNAPYPTLHECCFREASRRLERKLSHIISRHPSFQFLLTWRRILSQSYATTNPCGVGCGRFCTQNRIEIASKIACVNGPFKKYELLRLARCAATRQWLIYNATTSSIYSSVLTVPRLNGSQPCTEPVATLWLERRKIQLAGISGIPQLSFLCNSRSTFTYIRSNNNLKQQQQRRKPGLRALYLWWILDWLITLSWIQFQWPLAKVKQYATGIRLGDSPDTAPLASVLASTRKHGRQ